MSKGLMLGWVWELRWRQGQTAILTQSSSDHRSTSFSSWLSCSTVGHWGPKALSLQAGSASYLQMTQTVCALVILLFYVHLLPLFFRLFTQAHILIEGSVEGQYITLWLLRTSSADSGVKELQRKKRFCRFSKPESW